MIGLTLRGDRVGITRDIVIGSPEMVAEWIERRLSSGRLSVRILAESNQCPIKVMLVVT